ncbi:uncharacterized protein LOC126905085 [Daktulosphaira vitifoliae]|uniref:uncharacterized protein LOC126905085 n=1 Tax=Daktulosphaira vitifoliae TaxID=58002 RepID=UPI0021A98C75|nr:uncharacterized protein LOC126905085 [Daktulosphaira vitifoliae]
MMLSIYLSFFVIISMSTFIVLANTINYSIQKEQNSGGAKLLLIKCLQNIKLQEKKKGKLPTEFNQLINDCVDDLINQNKSPLQVDNIISDFLCNKFSQFDIICSIKVMRCSRVFRISLLKSVKIKSD